MVWLAHLVQSFHCREKWLTSEQDMPPEPLRNCETGRISAARLAAGSTSAKGSCLAAYPATQLNIYLSISAATSVNSHMPPWQALKIERYLPQGHQRSSMKRLRHIGVTAASHCPEPEQIRRFALSEMQKCHQKVSMTL